MSELRANQHKALEALTTGHTIAQTAVVAGVTERTIYVWKCDPVFKSELQRMMDGVIDDSVVFLSSCLHDAFRTMHKLLSSENETTQLSAARAIADSILKIRDQNQIITRIAALEAQLEQIN